MQRTAFRRAAGPLLFLPALACAGEQSEFRRPLLLAGVPYLAQSVITDTTGSAEAQRLTMEVPQSFDSVLVFYRAKLPLNGWRDLRESGDSAGRLIMARNDSVSLWLTVRWLESRRTEYTMIAGLTRDTTTRSLPPR
jgi:hypothetical protein